MSHTLKITVYNNRDYEQSFILNDNSGNPFNLTGCKLIWGFGTDSKTLGIHDSGSGANKCIFIDDVTSGSYTLKLPYSVLKPLEAGTYFHDLILVDSAGKRDGIWQGQLIVKRGIA
jgi:hypothetical protein